MGSDSPVNGMLGRTPRGRLCLQLKFCESIANQVVSVLLEAGAALDQQDNKGMCPLHWAVHRAHVDTVKLLLEAKAYPNNIGSLKLEESEEVNSFLI